MRPVAVAAARSVFRSVRTMRWRLWRRRWSVSAPRMTVRTHLPWPLRWAALALMLGFSAALALWAFEFGREIAGLDRHTRSELQALRAELAQLREVQQQAQSAVNAAQSLVVTERAAQEALAQRLRQAEAEKRSLEEDLGFFERLLPVAASAGIVLRGLQAEPAAPGQTRYQLLVMQGDKAAPEFHGRIELLLTGQLEGRPWASAAPAAAQPLRLKSHQRVAGVLEHPATVALKAVQVRVMDSGGKLHATQTLRL
jgi:hypothetical protein